MDEQQTRKFEEKAIRHENNLDEEHLSINMKLGDLIEDHLAGLASQNPDVHNIILEKIRNGFFEESQSRKAFDELADQILHSIAQPEEENANQSD
jgi:hypothetical protein